MRTHTASESEVEVVVEDTLLVHQNVCQPVQFRHNAGSVRACARGRAQGSNARLGGCGRQAGWLACVRRTS